MPNSSVGMATPHTRKGGNLGFRDLNDMFMSTMMMTGALEPIDNCTRCSCHGSYSKPKCPRLTQWRFAVCR